MSIGDVTSQMFYLDCDIQHGSFLQYMGKKPEVMIHGLVSKKDNCFQKTRFDKSTTLFGEAKP